ncbi:MAG: peptidylprolyl isomerase [bacterium]
MGTAPAGTGRLLACAAAACILTSCRAAPGDRVVARVNGQAITVSRLGRSLPRKVDPERDNLALVRRSLDNIIDHELLIQEAVRQGLDSVIEFELERARKAFVSQELYADVVSPARDVSEAALDSAYRGLGVELHLRVIEVEQKSLARRLERELAAGERFDSLAARWSELPNAAAGGDAGWMPAAWVEAPVKDAVGRLEPGGHTPALPVYGRWQILRLEDRREADPQPPPLEQIGGELTVRFRQFRQHGLAQEYMAALRKRLLFLPEGLALCVRPADSLTEAEFEAPVAVRDGRQYVKVGRLMHLLRRFPPALDSAMRSYAVRREVEEDLIYEDGLARGLDRRPAVRDSLDARRQALLYEALHARVVADRGEISEAELREHFEENRDRYPGVEFEGAAEHIAVRLRSERRRAARLAYAAGLRSRAKVRVDERVLRSIRQGPDGKWQLAKEKQ